jgi:hypothetical protein
VLKHADDRTEAAFVASLSADLPMVVASVATVDGAWVHGGWAATEWIDAKPDPSRWDDVLEIGAALHGALAALDPAWPVELDRRQTPWAIADRVAWGERPTSDLVIGLAAEVVAQALASARPSDAPAQVVHGDLAANVLFPSDGTPVVIDVSPYRRPSAFATAVAVVDQIAWYGAPPGRAHLVDGSALARAVVFRVVAAALHSPSAGDEEARRLQPLLG